MPNGYGRKALIVTMTTAIVGITTDGDFTMTVTMTMIVGMMDAMTLLLSMMVATMIVMTFVIVMKVAMTIRGSLTYDGGNDLQ